MTTSGFKIAEETRPEFKYGDLVKVNDDIGELIVMVIETHPNIPQLKKNFSGVVLHEKDTTWKIGNTDHGFTKRLFSKFTGSLTLFSE